MLLKKIVLVSLFVPGIVNAREGDAEAEKEQVKKGNLALPSSQQPSTLLGFGQTIVEKGNLLGYFSPDCLFGCNKKLADFVPYMVYGITDALAFYMALPVAHYKEDCTCSSGCEDIVVQLEYAFHQEETPTSWTQYTVVGGVYAPFGSELKNPTTGFGSTSFFLGLTAVHLSVDWYCYVAPAVLLTTRHCPNTKDGNQFWYQAGIGHNISYETDKWIFMWMLELIGTYRKRDRIDGIIDCNSGGNTILFGPSLWFSTQHLTLQASCAPVISEKLFGDQFKDSVYIAFNIGWKFH